MFATLNFIINSNLVIGTNLADAMISFFARHKNRCSLLVKYTKDNLGLDATKPVFWISYTPRLKPVSPATETS